MSDNLSDKQFGKLRTSIEWSERMLAKPRKMRIEAIREFVGYHYADSGSAKRVPVNFLKLAVAIYVRSLAARSPRALISTTEEGLKSTAANLEIAVNKIPDEIGLTDTLRRLVLEALFSFGVAKCGLYTTKQVLGNDYGESFIDVVTVDDLVIDMSARHISQLQYIGNSYWQDYEEVMESDWFPKENKEDLKADEYTIIGLAGEARAEGVTIGQSASLYKDKIWLRDVWLPKERLLVTYGVKSEKQLKVIERKKDGLNPYPILGFDDVPGNLLPLPPVAVWRDLHELANALFRKLGEGADAQKTVLGFMGGDDESVKDFQKASDGDGIRYSGGAPAKLTAGGIDQSTLLFFMQCKDLVSYFGGNLDTLGGLGSMTETVGQDKLLSEASSAQMRDMASRIVSFTKEIFRSLAYYEWNDPIKVRKLEKRIPGTDIDITVPWDRSVKIGKFDLYDLNIDVYSLQDNSPAIKLQKLKMILNEFILPLMPAIDGMGGTLNAQAIIELVAKYSDFPEITEKIVTFIEKPEIPKEGAPAMLTDTTRTYERISRPGSTGNGRGKIMQQILNGAGAQESEAAALTSGMGR